MQLSLQVHVIISWCYKADLLVKDIQVIFCFSYQACYALKRVFPNNVYACIVQTTGLFALLSEAHNLFLIWILLKCDALLPHLVDIALLCSQT